jgi:CheY-like chemotaxis protein
LSNAIKFTEHGHVKLELETELQEDGRVRLTGKVIDTGIGIDSQAQHKLFNAFSQCDASTTRLYGGTGLGLVIVKRLCNLMEGDVALVSSSPEKGTEFAFSLVAKLGGSKASDNCELQIPKSIGLYSPSTTFAEIIDSQFTAKGLSLELLTPKSLQQSSFDLIILDLANCSEPGLESTYLIESAQNQAKQICIICNVNSELSNSQLVKESDCRVFYHPFTYFDLMQLFTEKALNNKYKPTESEPVERAQSLAGLSVLLAEDNMVNQLVATKMLSNWQVEYRIANSGKEVLDIVEHATPEQFDVILMDCQMPILDGYQTTKELRANPRYKGFKDIPIIALTANAMSGDKEKCYEAGMNGYVTKPIEVDKLQAELERFIDLAE